MSEEYMKKPCQHCPFRNDVKPFLRPERAEELAYSVSNPFNDFPCHKTTEYDEDDDGNGDMLHAETSKTCAGFLTLRICEIGDEEGIPEGFEPSPEIVYSDSWEMVGAYEEEYENA